MDSEGTLRAARRTKRRAAWDLGISYLVGKAADDILEEGIKFAGIATGSSTASVVARYVGIGTGLLYFFGRHGRDVGLPQNTELRISFTRPVSISDVH